MQGGRDSERGGDILDFAPADDGIDVRVLGHDVRQRDGGDVLDFELVRNFLECSGHLNRMRFSQTSMLSATPLRWNNTKRGGRTLSP